MEMNVRLNKFQGCLVGSCIGDCLGAPFEGRYWKSTVKLKTIVENISISAVKNKDKGSFKFTDDTAMARSVCTSLIKCKEFNAVDMATRFTKEYVKEPRRGYGGSVVDIFNFWKNNGVNKENVFIPANGQFEGSGSYGNGAAMRVAPVALISKDWKECIKTAQKTALLTHSNVNGYLGATLQALAVHKALNKVDIKPKSFIAELKEEMLSLEKDYFDKEKNEEMADHEGLLETADDILHRYTRSKHFRYSKQLDVIDELYQLHQDNKNEDDVIFVRERLGYDVSAQQAVPAAIYSFVRNIDKGFIETLYYSISIGGDTDTISCMCLAIAGAYYGYTDIPFEWIHVCEGADEMKDFANEFMKLY